MSVWPSDEFAVILPETGIDDAERVAQKPIDLFDPTSRSEVATASISVGIARIDGGLEDVMKNADAALYRAKRAGGNRYATSEPRRSRSRRRLQMPAMTTWTLMPSGTGFNGYRDDMDEALEGCA